MKLFLICFGLVIIMFAFIPRIKKDVWWIRGFEFPHAQFTFLNSTVLLLFICYSTFSLIDISFILLCLVTLIYQAVILVSYTFLSKHQVQKCDKVVDKNVISILSANIYMYNTKYVKLQKLIEEHKPDVISLLEPNEEWRKSMEYLKKEYPYFVEVPQEDTYGLLFYSKFEFVEKEIHYLVENDVPSVHVLVKLKNDRVVNLHCLHPKPPSPTENENSTERDAEILIVAKTVSVNDKPTVVMGDLNDVAWSTTTRNFQKISGLLDPRIGRGFFNTFHTSFPFLRWPLDHFFHSYQFKLVDIKRLSNINSDHFPIYIKLHLENNASKQEVDFLENDEETEELALETINRVVEGPIPKITI